MDQKMIESIRQAKVIFAEGADGDPVLIWGEAVLRSTVENHKARELRILLVGESPEEAKRIVNAIKANVSDGVHGGRFE